MGGWFAYEKYWEYRVKEGAKALGYELWKRGGQDRKPSFIDSWEKQIADYQNPDKKKGEDSTPSTFSTRLKQIDMK